MGGGEFICKNILIGNVRLSAELWDTYGQERYRSLINLYLRNANAAIILFDVWNIGLRKWTRWEDNRHSFSLWGTSPTLRRSDALRVMSLRINLGNSTFPTFKYPPKLEQILMSSSRKHCIKLLIKSILRLIVMGILIYLKSQKTERWKQNANADYSKSISNRVY
jgi:GTPase SAR1 family protein